MNFISPGLDIWISCSTSCFTFDEEEPCCRAKSDKTSTDIDRTLADFVSYNYSSGLSEPWPDVSQNCMQISSLQFDIFKALESRKFSGILVKTLLSRRPK